MTGIHVREKFASRGDSGTRGGVGRGHVMTEAVVAVMSLVAKEHQNIWPPPEAGGGRKDPPPEPLEEVWPCQDALISDRTVRGLKPPDLW